MSGRARQNGQTSVTNGSAKSSKTPASRKTAGSGKSQTGDTAESTEAESRLTNGTANGTHDDEESDEEETPTATPTASASAKRETTVADESDDDDASGSVSLNGELGSTDDEEEDDDDDDDEEDDDEEETETGESRTLATGESEELESAATSTDPNHCKLCGKNIENEQYKKCVYDHAICYSCFGFGDELEPWGVDSQALSSNTCVVCQRKVLDKEKNVNGYPPRFLKFYLIRKLLEEDPPLCDVGTSHELGEISSVFFCIDCDVHACRECLLDHLDGEEKSSHNLLNLTLAAYKSEKLFCFECHQNEAVSYCPNDECDYPICANCVREKHRFHGTFILTESQRHMLMFINKQRQIIREYRQSVDMELQRRKELRDAKTQEMDNLLAMIKDAADHHRRMIEEDEKKLTDIVMKHRDEVFSVYDVIDNAVQRKDIILKYFEIIHTRLREKQMDDERRVDAFSFCRENDGVLKTHKELHHRLSVKFEAELATMKFKPRDNVEKFRLAGNNILGDLDVKERTADPDKLMVCDYVTNIDVRGRNDRIQPDITAIRYLHGTNKLALVDAHNRCVKIISKYNSPLYSKEEQDVMIELVGDKKVMAEGDRVLLEWNAREQLLIVCNATNYKMYIFSLNGKTVWSYDLPPGAGSAISLHHSADGALYVGRNHLSIDKYGGVLEIHMMLQRGRYQLLRQQDRYYLDHRPLNVTVSPSGHTIIYDGTTLAYLTKSLKHIRTEDQRHKEWHGLEASDMYMTDQGKLVLVDPLNLYPDNAITVLNEEGYVIGFPLASAGEDDSAIKGPCLITGDNRGHFYIVDSEMDKIKVLTYN